MTRVPVVKGLILCSDLLCAFRLLALHAFPTVPRGEGARGAIRVDHRFQMVSAFELIPIRAIGLTVGLFHGDPGTL